MSAEPTCAAVAVGAGVVSAAADDDLPLAGVGTHRVDAVEARTAGLRHGAALIHICRQRASQSGSFRLFRDI